LRKSIICYWYINARGLGISGWWGEPVSVIKGIDCERRVRDWGRWRSLWWPAIFAWSLVNVVIMCAPHRHKFVIPGRNSCYAGNTAPALLWSETQKSELICICFFYSTFWHLIKIEAEKIVWGQLSLNLRSSDYFFTWLLATKHITEIVTERIGAVWYCYLE
jgi:hypothetical protein